MGGGGGGGGVWGGGGGLGREKEGEICRICCYRVDFFLRFMSLVSGKKISDCIAGVIKENLAN